MGRTALAKWESFKSKIAQKQARDRSKRVDRSSCERNYRSRKSWWPRENLREESLVAHLRQPFERSRCDDSRTAGELAHHSAIGRPSIRTTIPKRPDTPRFRRHRSEPVPRRGAPRGLPRRAGPLRVRASSNSEWLVSPARITWRFRSRMRSSKKRGLLPTQRPQRRSTRLAYSILPSGTRNEIGLSIFHSTGCGSRGTPANSHSWVCDSSISKTS